MTMMAPLSKKRTHNSHNSKSDDVAVTVKSTVAAAGLSHHDHAAAAAPPRIAYVLGGVLALSVVLVLVEAFVLVAAASGESPLRRIPERNERNAWR